MMMGEKYDTTLTILWSVSTMIMLALTICGVRFLRFDSMLGKKTEKHSFLRSTIMSVSVGSFAVLASNIGFIILYTRIREDVYLTILWPTFAMVAIGGGLLWFSLFSITILSLQAMVLAESGIVATRKKWLKLLRKYGGLTLSFCFGAPFAILGLATFDLEMVGYCFISISSGFTFFSGILYGYMSYKFRTLAANQTGTNTGQERIPRRCRELHHFAMIISICCMLLSIALALWLAVGFYADDGLFAEESKFLIWSISILYIFMVCTMLQDISLIIICNDKNSTPQETLATPLLELGPITDADQHFIGTVPQAPRPSWLPLKGIGQANVDPNRWSISLENWDKFVRACMATTTWSALAENKGERRLNMYDINVHFIKPWTQGTGCSIACLMDNNQGPVDLMVSHAWAGSVVESLASIKTITNMYLLPNDTRIFFDAMCMYQAEDGALGGLSITEQLAMKPFTTIIHQKPQHGMFIIHTTISEVYERLWCVHEIDEAIEANIQIYGAFDPASWNDKALKSIVTGFSTVSAECTGEDHKKTLTKSINNRSGFDKLDKIVRDVRQQSIKDLESANLFGQLFGMSISAVERVNEA